MGTPPGESAGRQAAQSGNAAGPARSPGSELLPAGDPDQTEAELALAVDVKTGIGVTIGLIAFGMWLWMAQTNLSGLRWARIVATVLFGLNVIVTLYGMTQTTGFGIVVSIVSICLAGAILGLLYRQESTAYFVARSDGAH